MEHIFTSKQLEKLHRALVVLVPLVYVAVLSFSISDEWFPVDDPQELFYIRNLQTGTNLLEKDVFGLFRPIKNLLFFLFNFLFPYIGVRGCRFIGILVGVLSFFPVRTLCYRILNNKWKAIAAASIWLLSPTLVSSTAWLSCLNIQVMTAFAALAIVFHDTSWENSRLRISRVVLSGICFFVALISYEAAVSLLPIFVLFDILLRPGRAKSRTALGVYALHATVAIGYLALRHMFNAETQVSGNFINVSRWQIVLSSPFFVMQHVASWFWPFGRFTVLGGYKWGDVPIWTLSALWLFWIMVVILVFGQWNRRPVLSFGLLFWLFGFAPVSNCLGLGNGPYGDYYLNFASIGLSIVCVDVVWSLACVQGKWRRVSLGLAVLCILVRMATIPEAMRWARLWGRGGDAFAASIRNYPNVVSNKLAFIQWLSDQGRYSEAFELGSQIESSVGADFPKMATVHLVSGLHALNILKDGKSALLHFDRCESLHDEHLTPRILHYYRGCVFEDINGDEVSAISEYEASLADKWDVDLIPCADRLARLKAIQGERDEAIALWERAMSLDPENSAVLWNLSIAYREAGDNARSNELRERIRKLSGKR